MTRTVSIRLTRAELEEVLGAVLESLERLDQFGMDNRGTAPVEALERALAKLSEADARVQARERRARIHGAKVDAPDPLDRTQNAPKTAPKASESL